MSTPIVPSQPSLHKRRSSWSRLWFIIVGLCGLLLLLPSALSITLVTAQTQPTPIQLDIPTRTATPETLITQTPTRTPTAYVSIVRVEAKDAETGANIRAGPSTEDTRLGNIRPGKFYAVIGVYENWLQILYESSPNGKGWVYREIVNISGGDLSLVPTVDFSQLPTANAQAAQMQQTLDYITATPGALETATAAQIIATGVFMAQQETSVAQAPAEILPTFTYPPPFIEATLPSPGVISSSAGLPPIIPILGMGLLGLAGLLISGLRGMGR